MDVAAQFSPPTVADYRAPGPVDRHVWPRRVVDLDLHGDRVRVRVRLAGPPPIVAEVTLGALRELGLSVRAEVRIAVKVTEATQTCLRPGVMDSR